MTHNELRDAAGRLLAHNECVYGRGSVWLGPPGESPHKDAMVVAEGLLALLPPADDAEPVTAPAMRQEPEWTQAADANCFWRDGVLGTLRVWPNTGCVEFGNYVLVRAGATLGDIRKLAAVLCREGRA